MKDSAKFGMNRTGIQMAPLLTKEMETGPSQFPIPNLDTTVTPASLRKEYIVEAGLVGHVPMPGTLKGAISAGVQQVKGEHPAMLLDKLGERLAFERSGVRLYDALLAKCSALLPNATLDILQQFREEELQHFYILRDVIESIGGDPTAQTPCADTAGVQGMGLIQVLNDPRTSIPQCVEAILAAELIDNDSWGLLIQVAEQAGLHDALSKFKHAQMQEDKHLNYMRNWLSELVIANKAIH